jgi:uncharacterized membrane protein (DUF441 family)
MSAPPPTPPRLLGRLANTIVLGCLFLSVVVAAVTMLQNSDAFPLAMVTVAFFGVVLAVLPALVFLFYSWRRPPPDVPRGMRIAIYFSTLILLLVSAWLVSSGTGLDGAPTLLVMGALVGAVGALTIVQVVRVRPIPGADTQLTYGRGSVGGAFLFLLVAVMLPKFRGVSPHSAYRAMMTSDLRNLSVAQDAFFADSLRYASRADLGITYSPTSSDSVVIVAADKTGWRALARHPYLQDQECGIWVGTRPPDGMHGATEGEPKCWKVP